MADPEQLARLKRGVAEWNAWEEEHSEVTAQLSGADLIEADLSRADLSRADLRGAHLRGADLGRVKLSGADLRWANLTGAWLGDADLSSANLRWTNLSGAYLLEADLTNAALYETVFGDTGLTSVKGLESCEHVGPASSTTVPSLNLGRSLSRSSAALAYPTA